MKLKIELKPADADGLGGQVLSELGMQKDPSGPTFTKSIIIEEDDDVLDPAGYARPFVESLLDVGIKPRRVQTMMRDTGTVAVSKAIRAASSAIKAANDALLKK